MKTAIFKALWGMTGTMPEQLQRIKAANYDGIEVWVFQFSLKAEEWRALLDRFQLPAIAATKVENRADLYDHLHRLAEVQPVKINLHGGRDAMTRQEGMRFFEEALRVEQRIGVPVFHETHRGCLLYNPWTTADYLREFGQLKITADYSHWVNVCERLPDDQAEALDLTNRRVGHIHGRVGYAEGPQVPHPLAPEYAAELEWHERQWAAIYQLRAAAGDETLTFTPEYGPPNYLHTMPFTKEPVADLWEICLAAGERARQHFAALED